MFDLVVTHAFGHYQVGQRITDPDEVQGLLDSPHARSVVKVMTEPKAADPRVEPEPDHPDEADHHSD